MTAGSEALLERISPDESQIEAMEKAIAAMRPADATSAPQHGTNLRELLSQHGTIPDTCPMKGVLEAAGYNKPEGALTMGEILAAEEAESQAASKPEQSPPPNRKAEPTKRQSTADKIVDKSEDIYTASDLNDTNMANVLRRTSAEAPVEPSMPV